MYDLNDDYEGYANEGMKYRECCKHVMYPGCINTPSAFHRVLIQITTRIHEFIYMHRYTEVYGR